MKKKIVTIILILTTVFVVSPINTSALSVNNNSFNSIYILDENTDTINDILEETGKDQGCTGSNSLLGDPNDESSVAWLLQQILNFIKILGPILVVILSSVDFIQVIVKSDDESMGKAQKKLIKRLVLAALLFVIPSLVQTILEVFGITGDPTCGLS